MKFPLIPVTLGLGLTSAGAYNGFRTFENNQNDDNRIEKTASAVGRGALYSGAAVAGTYALTAGIKNPVSSVAKEVATKTLKVPKIFNNTTPITKDSLVKFGSNPLVLAGAAAGIGAVIGSKLDSEDPNKGALIGAAGGTAAGLAGSAAIKGTKLWSKIGPVGRVGSILGGSAALALGARAVMRQPEYESEDISSPDNNGGYSNISSSGLKERLNTMNAQGDIVFGLNKRR